MARKTWIQIDGKLWDTSEPIPEEVLAKLGPRPNRQVMPDVPDFVSPIDGTVVSGRAGLRDHCARHNVVPTAELAGLPPKPMNLNLAPTREQRQQTRQVIADVINSRSYKF